jgi:hypothetical protein
MATDTCYISGICREAGVSVGEGDTMGSGSHLVRTWAISLVTGRGGTSAEEPPQEREGPDLV